MKVSLKFSTNIKVPSVQVNRTQSIYNPKKLNFLLNSTPRSSSIVGNMDMEGARFVQRFSNLYKASVIGSEKKINKKDYEQIVIQI